LFFPKLRRQARWVFVFLAVVFGAGFVFFGVGSGSGGISDLLQGNFSDLFSSNPSDKEADKARDQIKENPKNAQAYRDLATALESSGKSQEAIAPLERYRALRPRDTDALNELASLYLTKADQARIRAQAVQEEAGGALATSTFDPNPSSKIGQALTGTADPITGADPINKAVQSIVSERSSKAFTEYSDAYKKAVSVYRAITKASPTDPSGWFQLAQAAEASGDTRTAIQAYERFLKLAPDDPNASAVRQRIKQLKASQTSASAQAGG
jgi:tetratricopeptide (TPR) repeat protein